MEKRKRLSEGYLESLAEDEYKRLKGRLVRVRAINGYADDIASDTFHPDMTGEPVVVRIGEASIRDDIHRWMDEWLDPAYPVEIVSRGDLPATLHSCWIYGNCRSLDGGFEPGDIWAMIGEHCDFLPIEEIARRLGGKVCDPPPKHRHMLAFLANRDKDAIYKHAMEISDQLTGKKPQTRKPVFCDHANECPSQCDCPPDCACRETMCRQDDRGRGASERTDELKDRVAALEDKVDALDALLWGKRTALKWKGL